MAQQQSVGGLVPGVSNGQLPDETTIEKLFPKCPPKQLQKERANNFRHNRSSFRHHESGRLQQKRQSRLRLQQQRQEILVDTTTTLTSTSKPPMAASSSSSRLKDKSHTGKFRERECFNSSSDSSGGESNNGNAKLGFTASSMKKATSNQHGFDTNNLRQNGATHQPSGTGRPVDSSKQRTRKYTASKNLQRQLQRSQSGHKLEGRALSMNAQSQLSEQSTIAIVNGTKGTTEPATRINQQVMPIDQSASKSPSSTGFPCKINPNAKANGRPNRNSRGIVFAEPHPVLYSSHSDNKESCEQVESSRVGSQTEDVIEVHTQSLAPRSQSPLGPVSIQVAESEACDCPQTADAGSCKNDATKQEQTQKAGVPIDASKPTTGLSDNEPDFIKHPIERPVDRGASGNLANVDKPLPQIEDNLKNDDKYINLFVYENATPPKPSEDELGFTRDVAPPSIPPKQQDIHPLVAQEERHQLLAADLSENEQDVIRNDTSVEELCDLDYETDAKRRLSNKNNTAYQKSPIDDLDTNAFNATKPYQKHHKSTATLETVDEKAEIIAGDTLKDLNGCSLEDGESSKRQLIDITENSTMFDEESVRLVKEGPGLTPPGFPRRVRPSKRPNDLPEQTVASVAENFMLSPTNIASPPTDKLIEIQSTQESLVKASDRPALSDGRAKDASCRQTEQAGRDSKTSYCQSDLSQVMSNDSTCAHAMAQNLNPRQHHKLPNETSHFSISRSPSKPHAQQNQDTEASGSRLQFNTLSDAESEPEERPNIQLPASASERPTKVKPPLDKKHDQLLMDRVNKTSEADGVIDDDLAPAAKTALVFPRLDEGLSSEAESAEDEPEEDDGAMEADVDADDDEDDEDDDDDDDDGDDGLASPLSANDRNPLHTIIDPYTRLNQGQISKPQNRVVGSLLQQQATPMAPNGSDSLQTKGALVSSPYANFETLDQSELKPGSSYGSQNGQSNYWPGAPNQPALSTQPSSSQSHFNVQRGQLANSNNGYNMNMNVGRLNSLANRDEAKSVNRLSSDTDNETDRLLGSQRNDQRQKMSNTELAASDRQTTNNLVARQSNSREVLIEGVLFSVKYLGSTQTECGGREEKEDRIHQAELAVHEVKFRNGDSQQPAEVQLFISTEKIMVLDDKHRKIMMDHSLRTISYIADIGDAFVLIVRKKNTSLDANHEPGRPLARTSCYVFESNESHTITKSISQAFQVAFTELMKANGTGDSSSYLHKELDYQEVLNSQEMSLTELEMFADKDNHREVIVPKRKGEILGIVIVESGWGSFLPTVVIASLKQDSPAYRCKKLSINDHILSINGNSLVGLPLPECQKILRQTKRQTVARLTVVPLSVTVEVKIKRPDTKYQLGFSVQHGVICSLLRGGIAERGGVRVGHRIISINGTPVVGVPHDKIVTLLASSVGEIRMQTCLTSLYRHMLGEEKNQTYV